MSLTADQVGWNAAGQMIIDDITLTLPERGTLGLIGPNGSGKSTLLRLLAGLRPPSRGSVSLDDRPLPEWPRKAVARRVAMVEQQAATEVDVRVQDIVRLGRTPHRGALTPWTREDQRIVDQALAQTGLAPLRDRCWHSLSGGERQRTQIARALAQCPSELLLDEPTNHLDIQHQLQLLQLIQALPVTCVMALHDLNLAAMYCDRLVLLHRGRVVASGTPAHVLTAPMIARVYGVRAQVSIGAHHGRPHIQYLP
ncbi:MULTISPECIES: ABC transporter ATP-binding protein [Pseudomonas]|uniref:ABC transporter ATP-binding protein n=1 Tax=Pseudomonas eucalypticola TaxID=2599595 RepID=A0A7D5H7F6_9PSED|nr:MULTISPECIES: ABC transporter ATP-binding protein [Pseudomonas]QKZ05983.1 ABC transporter ATP-binding protein [Pseudomonas eucalypticola]